MSDDNEPRIPNESLNAPSSTTVTPAGLSIKASLGNESFVDRVAITSDSLLSDDARQIVHQFPGGVRSEARLTADRVKLSTQGRLETRQQPDGTRLGELAVGELLAEHLSGRWRAGDEGDDKNKIDGYLELTNAAIPVQITMIPSDKDYWRQAALSSASTDVPYDHAVTWVYNALAKKTAHAASDRILAIDARHAGVVALEPLVTAYRAKFGDPAVFGFKEVWLVPPQSSLCTRLG